MPFNVTKIAQWNLMLICTTLFVQKANCAISQILNGTMFQNPAELSQINHKHLMAGNIFIAPTFQFTGTSTENSGTAESRVNDSLPYLLGAYRLNEKYVVGIQVVPSGYGHLDWPITSIVSENSTVTKLLNYRAGVQASYQFNDALALGVGFNFEYNKLIELDFVVPNFGNQVNKISGQNYTADVGLFYKLNARNYLTFAAYSPVNTYGNGSSSTASTTVNNFSVNIFEAPVVFMGIQHIFTDQLFLEGKIYWSGWSIAKNIEFINTTTGSFVAPANWKDVWTYQLSSRFAATDKFALLGAVTYDTNPGPVDTNQIGYPLSGFGNIAAGIDVALKKEISVQLVYSFGAFIPNASIDNSDSEGTIKANVQALTLQLSYKT